MKKILSLALSVVMLICVSAGMDFSAGAMANTGKIGNNVYYEFDSVTGALTISGRGNIYGYDDGRQGELDLPFSPFYNSAAIKTVVIQSDIFNIGNCLFEGCSALESIDIPDTVGFIGTNAFTYCTSLKKIVIPSSVYEVGMEAFYGCEALTDITIGSGVRSIDSGAFNIESLKEVKYKGTKSDWAKIKFNFGDYNWNFPNANIICTDGIICKTHKFTPYKEKATTKKNGLIGEKCTVCGNIITKTVINKIGSVKLSNTAYTYNGKAKKPAVTVCDSKGKSISAANYTVAYSKGRTAVGTYTIAITFKGNYSGIVKRSFIIKPQKVKKITAKKVSSKKISITWNKVKGVTGYEVYRYNYTKGKYILVKRTKKPIKVTLENNGKNTVKYAVRTYKTVGKKTYKSDFRVGAKKL
ncbi:MAG: leucine-rich repeat domain-containing protein [Eubacterium sp.]|nr:leucine-rich repeat domain-containing protein [Eubacterium sp.]